MDEKQDHFDLLRKIKERPASTQSELVSELDFSLRKLNYCLKSLKKKGHIKLKNFQNNKNKINYAYILTPRGLAIKTKLTVNFMKKKMKEYDELAKELKK